VAQCSCSAALQKWQYREREPIGPHHLQLTSTSAAFTSTSHTYLDTRTVARFSLFNSSTTAQPGFSFSSASSSLFFLRTHQVSPPSLPKAAAFSLAIRDSLHLVHLLSTQSLHVDQVSPPHLRKRASFLSFRVYCCYCKSIKASAIRSEPFQLLIATFPDSSPYDSRLQWT
jgi:hypothetical protein